MSPPNTVVHLLPWCGVGAALVRRWWGVGAALVRRWCGVLGESRWNSHVGNTKHQETSRNHKKPRTSTNSSWCHEMLRITSNNIIRSLLRGRQTIDEQYRTIEQARMTGGAKRTSVEHPPNSSKFVQINHNKSIKFLDCHCRSLLAKRPGSMGWGRQRWYSAYRPKHRSCRIQPRKCRPRHRPEKNQPKITQRDVGRTTNKIESERMWKGIVWFPWNHLLQTSILEFAFKFMDSNHLKPSQTHSFQLAQLPPFPSLQGTTTPGELSQPPTCHVGHSGPCSAECAPIGLEFIKSKYSEN